MVSICELTLLCSILFLILVILLPFATKERFTSFDPTAGIMETCRDIQLNGDILTAICKKDDGTEQETGINIQSCPLGSSLPQNVNGTLTCVNIGVPATPTTATQPVATGGTPNVVVTPLATWQTRVYTQPFKILDPNTNTVISFDEKGISKDSQGLPYTDVSFNTFFYCTPSMNC